MKTREIEEALFSTQTLSKIPGARGGWFGKAAQLTAATQKEKKDFVAYYVNKFKQDILSRMQHFTESLSYKKIDYEKFDRLLESRILVEETSKEWITDYVNSLVQTYSLTPGDKDLLNKLIDKIAQQFETSRRQFETSPEKDVRKLIPEKDVEELMGIIYDVGDRTIKSRAAGQEPQQTGIQQTTIGVQAPAQYTNIFVNGEKFSYNSASKQWSDESGNTVQNPPDITKLNSEYNNTWKRIIAQYPKEATGGPRMIDVKLGNQPYWFFFKDKSGNPVNYWVNAQGQPLVDSGFIQKLNTEYNKKIAGTGAVPNI